jgi:hypothetical protein
VIAERTGRFGVKGSRGCRIIQLDIRQPGEEK